MSHLATNPRFEDNGAGLCWHCGETESTHPVSPSPSPSPALTTAQLRIQARAAESRLDWTTAADLWRQARERYPLMQGRREYGELALADMENMRRFEATCRAMAAED